MQNEPTISVLVIGYGNPLRGDDGVGQLAAQAVSDWDLPNVKALMTHQLTPELSEPLSRSSMAVFVDATADTHCRAVRVCPVKPAEDDPGVGHTGDPAYLLALARALYGRAPEGWWVLLPAERMELGEGLSPLAAEGLRRGLDEIRRLISKEQDVA